MSHTARTTTVWITVLGAMACTACAPEPEPRPPAPEPVLGPVPDHPVSANPVAVYEQFWQVSRSAGDLDPARQQERLRSVATEAYAEYLLSGLQQHRDDGIALYGHITPRITEVDRGDGEVVIRDCQDASHAGQAVADTGEPRTVGVERNPVVATLLETEPGWRVSGVEYPGGEC